MSEVPENHTAQSISEEQTVRFVYHSHALVNAQQIVDRPVPINAWLQSIAGSAAGCRWLPLPLVWKENNDNKPV